MHYITAQELSDARYELLHSSVHEEEEARERYESMVTEFYMQTEEAL